MRGRESGEREGVRIGRERMWEYREGMKKSDKEIGVNREVEKESPHITVFL